MGRPVAYRSLIALGAAAAAALALIGTGAAAIFTHAQYSGTDTFTGCGGTYDVAASFSGNYLLRVGADGQTFPEQNTYRYSEVWTNRTTGKWFVVRGHGTVKDISSRLVSGTVYEFTNNETGQPLVVEDATGRVVLRDRGRFTLVYLWDTKGDGAPGGIDLGDVSTTWRGPHPSLEQGGALCVIGAELTAA